MEGAWVSNKELSLEVERMKRRNEKLKEENDKLHELAAHYRERYQSLVNKLVAKVDAVERG